MSVIFGSVTLLMSAKRVWMLVLQELKLRGRSAPYHAHVVIMQVKTGSSMLSAAISLFSCVTLTYFDEMTTIALTECNK
jgi:hypothetical protein